LLVQIARDALLHVTQSKFNPYKREIVCRRTLRAQKVLFNT